MRGFLQDLHYFSALFQDKSSMMLACVENHSKKEKEEEGRENNSNYTPECYSFNSLNFILTDESFKVGGGVVRASSSSSSSKSSVVSC